jgi:hypothetical protein
MQKGRWALNDFLSNTDSQLTVEGAFAATDIQHLESKGHLVTQIDQKFDKAYGPVSAIYKDKSWTGAETVETI